MERLYAVPSEKIRVWSVWLTKVEEEADKWHSWLQSHINLVLRLTEYLRRAEEEIEKEKKLRAERLVTTGEETKTVRRKGKKRESKLTPNIFCQRLAFL